MYQFHFDRLFPRIYVVVIEQTGSNSAEVIPNVQVRWCVQNLEVIRFVIACLQKLISDVPKKARIVNFKV